MCDKQKVFGLRIQCCEVFAVSRFEPCWYIFVSFYFRNGAVGVNIQHSYLLLDINLGRNNEINYET